MTKEQRQRLKVLMEGLQAANEIAEIIREKINALLMKDARGVKL